MKLSLVSSQSFAVPRTVSLPQPLQCASICRTAPRRSTRPIFLIESQLGSASPFSLAFCQLDFLPVSEYRNRTELLEIQCERAAPSDECRASP
jgi:hypothetical protein